MSKPTHVADAPAPISQNKPYLKELPPGEYRWCACGKSQDKPWCDDSHIGSTFYANSLHDQTTQNAADSLAMRLPSLEVSAIL